MAEVLKSYAEHRNQYIQAQFNSLKDAASRYEWDEAIRVLESLLELLSREVGDKKDKQIEALKQKIEFLIEHVKEIQKVAL